MKNSLVVVVVVAHVFLQAAEGFQSVTERDSLATRTRAVVSNNRNRGTPVAVWQSSSSSSSSSSDASTNTPDEARAAALSEYLAKSHEEKLRAIRDMEAKKNAEIVALKQEITALKQSIPATSSIVMQVNGGALSSNNALEDMTKEELVSKVLQYQNWMRQYMIDSQQQKYEAVQAAQDAAKKKWAETMLLLNSATSAASSSSFFEPNMITSTSASSLQQSPLYAARSAAVSKAAGKSRWGAMEVQRSASGGQTSTSMIPTTTTSTTVSDVASRAAAPSVGFTVVVNGATAAAAAVPATDVVNGAPVVSVPVPPEVADADHGLRADGGVGGLTLAERIYFGAVAAAAAPPPAQVLPFPVVPPPPQNAPISNPASILASSPMQVLYNQRNKKVLQAAKVGKSRWGAQEVERVSNAVAATTSTTTTPTPSALSTVPAARSSSSSAVPVPVPPQVAEADHGLRADGGVGGLTLAERIYFGASPPPARNTPQQPLSSAPLSSSSSPMSVEALYYTQRNRKVLQAAKAGKSRWGAQEVQRVSNIVAATTTPAAIPPSFEQRMNLGASIVANGQQLSASTSTAGAPASSSSSSNIEVLYTQRNIKVLQAAKAGKSRWGAQEVERVSNIVAATTPAAAALPNGAATATTSQSTFEQRMNLGASIVANNQ